MAPVLRSVPKEKKANLVSLPYGKSRLRERRVNRQGERVLLPKRELPAFPRESAKLIDAEFFEGLVFAKFAVGYTLSGQMFYNAGVCDTKKREIRISRSWATCEPENLLGYVVHEMIHAFIQIKGIVDDDDHGREFRGLARIVGISRGFEVPVICTVRNEEVSRILDRPLHIWRCVRCCRRFEHLKNIRTNGRAFKGNHDCRNPKYVKIQ